MSDLSLEKIKVSERLSAVEEHMRQGEENRKVLISGFTDLKESVEKMETTLFGDGRELGLAQRMDAFLKVADTIKGFLQKIFIAICTAITLSILPSVLKYVSQVLIHHGG